MSEDQPGAETVRPGRESHASLWVFVLAGPLFGEVLVLWALGAGPLTLPLLLAGLPPAYAIGLVPALLVGVLDQRLARGGFTALRRLVSVAIAGAAAGLAVLLPLYGTGLIHGADPLMLPLVTSASASFCLVLVLAWERLAAS